MKLLAGWAVSAGLMVAATAAHAQMAVPRAASDFDAPGPYVEEAPPPPVPPAPLPRPYGYGPGYGDERDYAYRPDRPDYGYRGEDRYGPGPDEGYAPRPQYGYGGPPLIPVPEVYAVLRDNGFSPLGVPHQRGNVYVVAVIDRHGEDGHLVIDGRNGRIIRFTPAYHWGNSYNRIGPSSALVPPRGAAGPLPPIAASQSMPPASLRPTVIQAPRLASRSGSLPSDKPPVAAAPPRPAPQQSAAAERKPSEAAPATTASVPAQAKPSAPPSTALRPSQPMPPVQDLE